MTKTKEERLAQQRLCKRRKYAEIKSDPVLYALEKERQHAKYEKRKTEKKQKPISDKSPREQRYIRKQWKENSKNYRERKKEEKYNVPINTVHVVAAENFSEQPSTSNETEDPISTFTKYDLIKEKRRIRYVELKKRIHLIGVIKHLRKINQVQRMKITRLKEVINKSNEDSTKEKVQEDSYYNIQEQKKKKIYNYGYEPYNLRSKKDMIFHSLRKQVIDSIKQFYNDDAVSTICSGKKEYITRNKCRMQKRYLTAPLKILHKKMLAETDIRVSYSFFTKHRPFWVLFPKYTNRETCSCVQHTNMELLIKALNIANIIKQKNSSEVISYLCCEPRNVNCLLRQCNYCKHKAIHFSEFSNSLNLKYYQWRKKTKEIITKKGLKKKQIITIKDQIIVQPLSAIKKFEGIINAFLLHVNNVESQYTTMKNLKEQLEVTEAVIHVDFSENYALKYTEEVHAFHFGGSLQQVSLHTSVIYTHDFTRGQIIPKSVCTISSCIRHDAAAIWAHLIPLIRQALKINPFVTTLHFISDSPISQYRNKYMFYIITQIQNEFEVITRVTWNYTEAGHGKGAPDGVGAVLKRTADRMVNFGKDIGDFDTFSKVLQENIKNIIVKSVEEDAIKDKESLLPKNLKSFKGTLSVHQVLWDVKCRKLALRNLSCLVCDIDEPCIHGRHLGFYEINEPEPKKNRNNSEYVLQLADTAPQKKKETKITILSDITFKTNENLELYLGTPSTSKSQF